MPNKPTPRITEDHPAVEKLAKRQHEARHKVDGDIPPWEDILDPWRATLLRIAHEDLEAIAPLLRAGLEEERDREAALREDAYRYQQAAEDLLNPEQKRASALTQQLAEVRAEVEKARDHDCSPKVKQKVFAILDSSSSLSGDVEERGEEAKRQERHERLLGKEWPSKVTLMRDAGPKSSPPWTWWEVGGYDDDKYEVEDYVPAPTQQLPPKSLSREPGDREALGATEEERQRLTEIGVGIQLSVERKEPFPGTVEDARFLYKLSSRFNRSALTQPPADPEVGEDESIAGKLERVSRLIKEVTEGPDPYTGDLLRFLGDLAKHHAEFEDVQLQAVAWYDGLCWLTVKVPKGIVRLVPESTYSHPEADPEVPRCGAEWPNGETEPKRIHVCERCGYTLLEENGAGEDQPCEGVCLDEDGIEGQPTVLVSVLPVADCQSTPELLGEEGSVFQLLTVGDDTREWAEAHPAEMEALRRFVGLMLGELAANDGKGNRPGWLQMDRKQALAEVHWHAAKLAVAAKLTEEGAFGEDPDEEASDVREHAADVGNCALMVLDCMGLLLPPELASNQPVSESPGNSRETWTVWRCGNCGGVRQAVGEGRCAELAACRAAELEVIKVAPVVTQPVPGNSGGVEEGRKIRVCGGCWTVVKDGRDCKCDEKGWTRYHVDFIPSPQQPTCTVCKCPLEGEPGPECDSTGCPGRYGD